MRDIPFPEDKSPLFSSRNSLKFGPPEKGPFFIIKTRTGLIFLLFKLPLSSAVSPTSVFVRFWSLSGVFTFLPFARRSNSTKYYYTTSYVRKERGVRYSMLELPSTFQFGRFRPSSHLPGILRVLVSPMPPLTRMSDSTVRKSQAGKWSTTPRPGPHTTV